MLDAVGLNSYGVYSYGRHGLCSMPWARIMRTPAVLVLFVLGFFSFKAIGHYDSLVFGRRVCSVSCVLGS